MKRILILLSLASFVGGCSPAADTKAAEEGVTSFHDSMEAGEYAAIYDQSSSDMKSAISRDDFIKLLAGLHDKLGAFKAGKTTSWNDNATTGGHYVTLSRDAQFDNGPGTEQFVFKVDKGRTVLAGYHINSNVLITG